MGTKVIKLIIISLTFFSYTVYGQTQEDKIKYMKKYAYCNCVYINNNKLDTIYLSDKFQLNDKSEKLFVDLGEISEIESAKIRKFIEKQTKDFASVESSYHSETGTANTITADCLNFYESKELDIYIKEIVNGKNHK